MKKLKPLLYLAFVLVTLFLASCASQTQPVTTSTTTIWSPWTKLVTASLPLYISKRRRATVSIS